MASFTQPTIDAVQQEITRFLVLGRDEYLNVVGPRRGGRSYFIRIDDHFLDMKAIWYGACQPKPKTTPNSVTIAPILRAMGFDIFHGAPEVSSTLIAIEKHKRIERIFWTRNRQLAEQRKQRANFRCEACESRQEDKYDGIDGSLLETHHVKSFGSLPSAAEEHAVGIDDVIAICANCHRMIHALARQRAKNPTLQDFRSMIKH